MQTSRMFHGIRKEQGNLNFTSKKEDFVWFVNTQRPLDIYAWLGLYMILVTSDAINVCTDSLLVLF